ncbi:MAG TPA: hypothetical protein VGT44_18640 [Ktedonobacteraceae bacterium]|nr:hypothetical protein [Ktedonobacteraceae bacterium]
MDIQLYAIHVVPVILIVYFAFALFLHTPKEALLASLLGGLVMAILNALGDLLAYYASWWHYAASGLILQLPLPFYLTPLFIFGGLAYLLTWRFSKGREQAGEGAKSSGANWPTLALLLGVPLLGFARDLLNAGITHSSFLVWDSPLAGPIDFVLWLVMFYAGYTVFRRVLASRGLVQTMPGEKRAG